MIEIKGNIEENRISLQEDIISETSNTQIITTKDIKELIETTNNIKNILLQLLDFEKEINDIDFIPRKDIKSLFKCTDTTVAKLFNRPDFPAIMIGEHKVEKSALKKWLQERRT